MTTGRDKLANAMFQTVCDLVYEEGAALGKDEWQKIFKDAMRNAFPDHSEDAGDLSA